MTTIADLQNILSPPATPSTTATSTANDAQDRFLKLLVTQMQNQDPLNPMDNSQVTTQLAQLNTVTGIDKLNSTLTQMAASTAAQQALQAAMLVGRQVLVDGNQVAFSGSAVTFGISLPQAVDNMTINIADSKGNVVESFETGPQFQGATTFQWDGLDSAGAKLPSGTYTVSASGIAAGAPVTATPLVSGTVLSVGSAADGNVQLQLSGEGSVGINDIKRFL
jgi:flagellar basal-body rod modification protein FlgD